MPGACKRYGRNEKFLYRIENLKRCNSSGEPELNKMIAMKYF
jgi:hypothetical protein